MPNKSKAKPRTVDRWNWNSHKFADAAVIVRYVRCSFGVFVFLFWLNTQTKTSKFRVNKENMLLTVSIVLGLFEQIFGVFSIVRFFLHFFIARNEFFTLFDDLWRIFECGRRADISVGSGASPFFVASLLFALFSCLNLF